jgi:beta-glucosidase
MAPAASLRSLRLALLTSSVLLFAASGSAQQVPDRSAAHQDAQRRATELVSKMTLAEKVSQMQNHAVAIPRLNVPEYDWWNEGLHGIARSGYATVFPQAIGMAATWDRALLHDAATVISTEARAKNAEALRRDNHSIYFGLDLWSPNINIFRDPRWGRGQETYGEDPFLTGRLGVAFVTGLQGDDPRFYRVISTPKHFAVHSGPESTRHTADVIASPHDLEDTYLPAFRATLTEAQAGSTMCAYNSLDGQPACANTMLLKDTLRGAWGFHGYVTSDCWAITDIAVGHKFAPDMEHAAVDAVRAGTDTSCGKEFATLTKAVADKLIAESELDLSVIRLFTARYELGLFDPPAQVAFARIPFTENDSAAHRALALKSAQESIVLLKNDGVLPFNHSIRNIAVIGPNAAALSAIEGNYNAVPSQPVTPLAGMEQKFGKENIRYAQGSPYAEGAAVPVPRTALHPAAGDPRGGLSAKYFSNAALSGTPALQRVDAQINFDWNSAAPAPAIDPSAFSVRWSGTLTAPSPGDYTFSFKLAHCYPCNDAETVRVFFDGKQVDEQLFPQKESRSSDTRPFTMHFADSTTPHALRIEYLHEAPLFGAGLTLDWRPDIAAEREQAVAAARQSDAVVAFIGLTPELEGEEMDVKIEGFAGGDRTSIGLPRAQQQMLEAVVATGKPLVVVLLNGSAIAAIWAKEHANAIVEAWYPGEEGGTAIAATLAGDANPAGRLPVTFYASADQLPPFADYSMKGRTYRYFSGEPLFPFGSGLSYSSFTYSNVQLSTSSLNAGDTLTVEADVHNSSTREGDEVAELYLLPPSFDGAPRLALEGFDRLHLKPNETRHVNFKLDPRQLSTVDSKGVRAVRAGDYRIALGGSQPTDSTQTLALHIIGSKELPR